MTEFLKIVMRFLFIVGILLSCESNDKNNTSLWDGSGVNSIEFNDKIIRIFYYAPSKSNPQSPVLIVFHGANRNAMDYRDALISKAEEYGVIVVVPEFSEENFPGVSPYQLGNIFEDGESPTAETLQDESLWTFQFTDILIPFVKTQTKTQQDLFYYVGHSGGAQFLHRMLLFKPDFQFKKAIVSAAGWYSIPDTQVNFPHGLKLAPYQMNSLTNVMTKEVIVQVGTADNDPNSSSLRRDATTDLQGIHRLERAQYFYQKSQQFASNQGANFNWELKLIPGLTHNYPNALGKSVDLLFD